MTGELAAFMVFISLMLVMIGWLLRRGQRALEQLDRDVKNIEELRKQPP